ncbi:sodium:proton antiporter [Desulfovibrio litoralis]|uniref:Transporter, UIT6 family n=1 Tax=Desulfovibrio litoralis DSM 11393 TaxID=1121455 RepID=A0A1M7SD28_9BACT|nr:sodium:proton antiporter [Desulfovibrio litoralis]SHN56406.1 transporter, UIT6 family [Desulfovibrio litoralis DSM 11393]
MTLKRQSGLMLILSALMTLCIPALCWAIGTNATEAAHVADVAHAAPHLDGAELSIMWIIPFACMLLSIAIFPLVAPNFWHHHFGKVSAFWALAFLVPFTIYYGSSLALYEVLHTILGEYIPFIILLFSLFTVAGGVRLKGSLAGTPAVNLTILLIGTLLASWMGTTGAAMLFIRPLLRAINHRKYKVHTVVFFIFLVANIGGSLTPLGDPPLFLGFLKGVPFFWTAQHMWPETLFAATVLLTLYFVIDTVLYKKEGSPEAPKSANNEKLAIDGGINLFLLLGVVAAVLMSGMWKPGSGITVYHVTMELQNIARDVILVVIALLSLKLTTAENRRLNEFSWFPIVEVGKLFLGIFISMIPAIAILKAAHNGALRDLISLVTTPDGKPVDVMYFWLTGMLSSFLDNAPTYLVFFNTAGGDAVKLTTEAISTLVAISAGAVFMGANTYIGNAPNFMVRSIAEDSGVKMPSFFGYMAWSFGILVPLFAIMTVIFF